MRSQLDLQLPAGILCNGQFVFQVLELGLQVLALEFNELALALALGNLFVGNPGFDLQAIDFELLSERDELLVHLRS